MMFLSRLKKIKGNMVLTSAPTSVRLAKNSESLAAKFEAQVKWMRERGITASLDGTQKQNRKSVRVLPTGLMKSKSLDK